MANPREGGDSAAVLVYGGRVTDTPASEPTNADLLAFMQTAFAQLTTAVATVNAKVDELGVKVDAVEDRLRGEIQATEADLASRIGAVQDVLRTVKADIASHVDNPANHHRHAA